MNQNYQLRHSIHQASRVELFRVRLEYFAQFLELIPRDPNNLAGFAGDMVDVVGCGLIAEPNSPEIPRGVRLRGQCIHLFFQAVLGVKPNPTWQVENVLITQIVKRPDESLIESGLWLDGFFSNLLCRQHTQLASLCDVPTSLLLESSTTGPPFHEHFVDVLKAFSGKLSTLSETVKLAEDSTSKGSRHAQKWIKHIGLPLLDMVKCLVRNGEGIDECLIAGLTLHQKFWSSTQDLRNNPEGYLSWGLSALAGLARDRGISIGVQSDYLPERLVSGEEFR